MYNRVHDLGRPPRLVVVITVLIPYSNSQTTKPVKEGQISRLLDAMNPVRKDQEDFSCLVFSSPSARSGCQNVQILFPLFW